MIRIRTSYFNHMNTFRNLLRKLITNTTEMTSKTFVTKQFTLADITTYKSDPNTIFEFNSFKPCNTYALPNDFFDFVFTQKEIMEHIATHFLIESDTDCDFALRTIFIWAGGFNLHPTLTKAIDSNMALREYIRKGTSSEFVFFLIKKLGEDSRKGFGFLIRCYGLMDGSLNRDVLNLVLNEFDSETIKSLIRNVREHLDEGSMEEIRVHLKGRFGEKLNF